MYGPVQIFQTVTCKSAPKSLLNYWPISRSMRTGIFIALHSAHDNVTTEKDSVRNTPERQHDFFHRNDGVNHQDDRKQSEPIYHGASSTVLYLEAQHNYISCFAVLTIQLYQVGDLRNSLEDTRLQSEPNERLNTLHERRTNKRYCKILIPWPRATQPKARSCSASEYLSSNSEYNHRHAWPGPNSFTMDSC